MTLNRGTQLTKTEIKKARRTLNGKTGNEENDDNCNEVELVPAPAVLLSIILIIYAKISWITGHVVAGWASSFIGTTLIGGIQLISLGVIGEYVGKIYMETKGRPRYIIDEHEGFDN